MKHQVPDDGSVVLLSSTRSIANAFTGMVNHPADIDGATDRLGIPPALVNPALSSAVDLGFIGLGTAVHVPVQVSPKAGGRKSLYFLRTGERVLSGLLMTPDGVISRYTTRESGNSMPAATGDEFSEELRGPDGDVVATLYGTLEVEDRSRGHGSLIFSGGSPARVDKMLKGRADYRWVWYFWSMIATGSARIAIVESPRADQGALDIRGDEPVT